MDQWVRVDVCVSMCVSEKCVTVCMDGWVCVWVPVCVSMWVSRYKPEECVYGWVGWCIGEPFAEWVVLRASDFAPSPVH